MTENSTAGAPADSTPVGPDSVTHGQARTARRAVRVALTEYVAPDAQHAAAPGEVVIRSEEDEVVIEAATRVTLRVGASSLSLHADGTIELRGTRVTVAADEIESAATGHHGIRGAVIDLNYP